MAINAKAVKSRIKSVKNTEKITKAMEMVSAAKMRKAVEAAKNTRLYATLARELMEHLGHIDEPNIPLLEQRQVKKLLAVVVSSNRGLCGSFNGSLFKKTKATFDDKANLGAYRNGGEKITKGTEDFKIDIIAIGKKAVSFAKKHGYTVVAAFDSLPEKPKMNDMLPIAHMATSQFVDKTYDKVVVTYTEFQSSLVQDPKVRQLLPISKHDLEKMIYGDEGSQSDPDFPIESYYLEPDLDTVVAEVMPRLVEIQLYQAVLESAASEHSARMVAMKNASENAADMIQELNLTYNKARQAAITQEIAEIAGGAAALE